MQKITALFVMLALLGAAIAGCTGEEIETDTDTDTGGDTGGTTNETSNQTAGENGTSDGGGGTTTTLTPLTSDEVLMAMFGEDGDLPDPTESTDFTKHGMRIIIDGPMEMDEGGQPMDTTITITEMEDGDAQRVMNSMIISMMGGMMTMEMTETQGLASDGSGNGIVNVRATQMGDDMTPGGIMNFYAIDHDWDFDSAVADLLDMGDEDEEREDEEMTQEDCELRGGTWTEAPDREGEYYCDIEDDDHEEEEITQEDCELRGGTWTQDETGDSYCDIEDDGRDEGDAFDSCNVDADRMNEYGEDGLYWCVVGSNETGDWEEFWWYVDRCEETTEGDWRCFDDDDDYDDDREDDFGDDMMEPELGFGEPDMDALGATNWTTTFDETAGVQTFTGEVDMGEYDGGMTTITLSLVPSDPPMPTSIVMDNGTMSQTIEFLFGDAVSIDLVEEPTTGWTKGSTDMDVNWAQCSWDCEGQEYEGWVAIGVGSIEVPNSQVELHILGEEEYDAENGSMIPGELLESLSVEAMISGTTWTDTDGAEWSVTWSDTDTDGLISVGDTFSMNTDDDTNVTVGFRIYDTWSEDYAGSMDMPGFTAGLSLVATLGACLLLRRREL